MTPFLTIIVIFVLVVILALVGYSVAWLLLINAADRLTKRQLAPRPGMNVIDIGCGSGRLTTSMAQQVGSTGSVPGIDMETGRVQRVEQRTPWSARTFVLSKQGLERARSLSNTSIEPSSPLSLVRCPIAG